MLVLARKLGESISIGEGIVIKVVEVGHRRIRLGIEAPPAVRIRRREHVLRPDEIEYAGQSRLDKAAGVC